MHPADRNERLSPHPVADRHLGEIWKYSADRWGADRADRYLAALHDTLCRVVLGRVRLRPSPQYGKGLHAVLCGSHVIYVRPDASEEVLGVVGILHKRMHPPLHLPKDD